MELSMKRITPTLVEVGLTASDLSAIGYPPLSFHDGAIWSGETKACVNLPAATEYLGVKRERTPLYEGGWAWFRRLLGRPSGYHLGYVRAWWRVDGRLATTNLEGQDLQVINGR